MSERCCPQRGIVGWALSRRPVGLCWRIHRRWSLWTFHHGEGGRAEVGFTPCFVPNPLQHLIDLFSGAVPPFTLQLAAMRRWSWVVFGGYVMA